MAAPLVLAERMGDVARLTLNRPERHNSLVPELVEALIAALDQIAISPPRVVVLAGAGRSFSTGGDIHAFAAAPAGERRVYAADLVVGLNAAILKLVALPCPVIARVQGAVTGGSLGFVLASDMVVMAQDAFIAPYYSEVGFSPDGGWTALLPERIGSARAGAILMRNSHVSADEAHVLGLASLVCPTEALDAELEAMIAALLAKSRTSLAATKTLLWPPKRRARLVEGLARELDSFLDLITVSETEVGMTSFLSRPRVVETSI